MPSVLSLKESRLESSHGLLGDEIVHFQSQDFLLQNSSSQRDEVLSEQVGDIEVVCPFSYLLLHRKTLGFDVEKSEEKGNF